MKNFYWAIGLNCVFASALLASPIEWDNHDQTYVLCDTCPVSRGLDEKMDISLSIKTSMTAFTPADTAPEPSQVEVIYFERGSYELSEKDQDRVIRLAQEGRKIHAIRGYASEDGTPEFNHNLSLQRAGTIADILKRHGRNVQDLTGEIEWGREPYSFSRKAEIHYDP